MLQSIDANSKPDVGAPVQTIAPESEPTTKEESKVQEMVIEHLRCSIYQVIDYIKLGITILRIMLFSDS